MSADIEITRYTCHLFSSRDRDDMELFLYADSTVVGRVCAVPDGEPLPT